MKGISTYRFAYCYGLGPTGGAFAPALLANRHRIGSSRWDKFAHPRLPNPVAFQWTIRVKKKSQRTGPMVLAAMSSACLRSWIPNSPDQSAPHGTAAANGDTRLLGTLWRSVS